MTNGVKIFIYKEEIDMKKEKKIPERSRNGEKNYW